MLKQIIVVALMVAVAYSAVGACGTNVTCTSSDSSLGQCATAGQEVCTSCVGGDSGTVTGSGGAADDNVCKCGTAGNVIDITASTKGLCITETLANAAACSGSGAQTTCKSNKCAGGALGLCHTCPDGAYLNLSGGCTCTDGNSEVTNNECACKTTSKGTWNTAATAGSVVQYTCICDAKAAYSTASPAVCTCADSHRTFPATSTGACDCDVNATYTTDKCVCHDGGAFGTETAGTAPYYTCACPTGKEYDNEKPSKCSLCTDATKKQDSTGACNTYKFEADATHKECKFAEFAVDGKCYECNDNSKAKINTDGDCECKAATDHYVEKKCVPKPVLCADGTGTKNTTCLAGECTDAVGNVCKACAADATADATSNACECTAAGKTLEADGSACVDGEVSASTLTVSVALLFVLQLIFV